MKRFFNSSFLVLLLFGCRPTTDSRPKTRRVEVIQRLSTDPPFSFPAPTLIARKPYSWEPLAPHRLPPITKEHFRCRGDQTHPYRPTVRDGEEIYIADCDGIRDHTLPMCDGKEFIYPILPTLLNYLQNTTGKKVIVTAGHRCPTHQLYLDDTFQGETSKHQIGAEATFYVEGMEQEPLEVISHLLAFYVREEQMEMREFKRYEKGNTNVQTLPWYNKEIFIKLFTEEEGRDLDNDHPYPYIAIQVRWDRDTKTPVQYTWPLAHRGYYRSPPTQL